MIELQKHVLNQVYKQPDLFMKELMKSKKWLNPKELNELKNWLYQKKFNRYRQVIEAILTDSYELAS
ncbi:hypothetical protein [Wenyingzhuangia sp. IMCC45574]